MILKIGDLVRWDIDVDKAYSRSTKTLVGSVGVIVEPKGRHKSSQYNGNEPGCFDVEFTLNDKPFVVWNIPYNQLVRVEHK